MRGIIISIIIRYAVYTRAVGKGCAAREATVTVVVGGEGGTRGPERHGPESLTPTD